ncbi:MULTISPECIES: transcription antitermination factor NusB [unclassified Iodobacter]|uniref:transcription antitermination factor NusB n=1 Tax=unclassified Iodobacter TaxID=235634 RepID=UPI0025FA4E6E|nr:MULTISPECIES: transcription antitermination factor NusB [unclassified Iodobacter]MDW5416428.1 transcription antitermination factor NusB [Iodobacter sp. CM08]
MTSDVAKPKSSRRLSREFAVQGVYQWLLAADTPGNIEEFLSKSDVTWESEASSQSEKSALYKRADKNLFRSILFGVIKDIKTLQIALSPHLDRPMDEVSVVEAAVLYVGAFEIVCMPETPYPVIINEAIELAKTFGGLDGHKFVNGVLDKLAESVRADEVVANRAKRRA